jgi:hypothetical protein
MRSLITLAFSFVLAAGAAAQGAAPQPTPPDPSLHMYRELLDGGTLMVVAHHVGRDVVRNIRSQLRKDAAAYGGGDYPDPVGPGKTPAVAKLRAGAPRIGVSYTDIEDGGAIRFKTKDASLVGALHDWFAATVRENRKKNPGGGPGMDGY